MIEPARSAHHDGSEAYLTNPNPELDETVTALLRVPRSRAVTEVHARVVIDAEPHSVVADLDHSTDTEDIWRVDITARNPVTTYRFHLREASGQVTWLNGSGEHGWEVTDSHDFRLSTEHRPPDWVHGTVWYQIFPDRFARRADGELDGPAPEWATIRDWADPVRPELSSAMTDVWGGSLNGVADHLDHITDLGANGIYLCPVFPGYSNHRYDAVTFDEVDPLLGGEPGMSRLAAEAEAAGIHLMADLTTNHSGSHHRWFEEARRDPASLYRSYYMIAEDGSYESWLGVRSLPKLDHRSLELREGLYGGADSVAGRVLGWGFDGLRIDVANMTGRHGVVDENRACAEGLRRTIDEVRPGGWLLAEHGHDASADLDGGGWHGTMNYAGFTQTAWTWLHDANRPVRAFGHPGPIARRFGPDAVLTGRSVMAQIPYSVALTNMNLLGSHDSARWAFTSGADAINAVGLAMLMAWPGSPSIFYGDEIGLGGDATWDVATRQPFPWHDPSSWNTDLLEVYRTLVEIRRSSQALAVGGMRWLEIGADHLVWLREARNETVLVQLARDAHDPVELDVTAFGYAEAEPLAGSNPGATARIAGSTVHLSAESPTWTYLRLTK